MFYPSWKTDTSTCRRICTCRPFVAIYYIASHTHLHIVVSVTLCVAKVNTSLFGRLKRLGKDFFLLVLGSLMEKQYRSDERPIHVFCVQMFPKTFPKLWRGLKTPSWKINILWHDSCRTWCDFDYLAYFFEDPCRAVRGQKAHMKAFVSGFSEPFPSPSHLPFKKPDTQASHFSHNFTSHLIP